MQTPDPEALAGRVIETTRLIDAPPDLVFDAWSDPRHLTEWWGPNGFSTTTSAFDMRPGGIWRFVMHGPDGRDYPNVVTFEAVERPRRIAYRHGGENELVDFQVEVTFAEEAGRTRMTFRQVHPTKEERDRVVRDYGAEQGLHETVGRLAALAPSLAAQGRPRARLVFVRTFDAPRALVWRAWTEADRIAQWWGPHGFDVPVCEMDAQPGGALRIDMRAPDGGVNMVTGVVEEASPPARLVFTTEAFRDAGGRLQLRGWNAVTLEERGGKTTMTVEARILEIADWLVGAGALRGMAEGWAQQTDKLAAWLAGK